MRLQDTVWTQCMRALRAAFYTLPLLQRADDVLEVDADTVAAADVVVTMGVSHVMELAARFDGCHDKTLTLRELATHVSSSEVQGPLTLDQVQAEVAAACDRPLAALLGGNLDVDDPIGMPTSRFRKTGNEVTELFEVVVDAWFPLAPRA